MEATHRTHITVGTAVSLLLLVSTMLTASNANADGFMFQPMAATGEVRADAQRAILWLRDGQWELSIYPVFSRDAGDSAWVVPFPVRPTISEGSADLFDELETITAPVTIEFCYEPHCCCPGDEYYCDVGAAGEGDPGSATPDVDVWERGTVGSLDYVVLSSADGDSIAAWLGENGFVIPDGSGDTLDTLAAEGSFFFASKLSVDADPNVPVSPVTFALPELEDPMYPLRLTAAGAPEGEGMELILWVVTPKDQVHAVSNDFEPTIDFHGVLAFHPFVEYSMDCVDLDIPSDYDWIYAWCVDFTMFGYELMYPYSAPLQEILDGEYVVTRYADALDAEEMAQDMHFAANEDPDFEISDARWDMTYNIHGIDGGDCYSCPPCPDYPDADPDNDAWVESSDEPWAERVEPSRDAGVFPEVGTGPDMGTRTDTRRSSSSGMSSESMRAGDDERVSCESGPGRPVSPWFLMLALLVLVAAVARSRNPVPRTP